MNCLPTGLSVSKKVLLTGAGFTKDFGGFLASEMWAFIFNNPSLDKHPKIKNILRHDFSYESVYHEVIENPKFNPDEKDAIKEAVNSAYDMLDRNIREYRHRIANRIANSNTVTDFIQRFRGNGNSRGFFFTLNQDIFVERYCGRIPTHGVLLQGINQDNILENFSYQQLPDQNRVTEIFDKNNPSNPHRSDRYCYVKLHGSYHWRDSAGNAHMVIGENKTDRISREPLLEYYFNLFKKVLESGNVDLFVIGYGFGDEHINNVIAESIRDNGLKLHVMNPDAPEMFKKILSESPHCEDLWNNLNKYYPCGISRVFPQNGKTIEHEQIMNNFFQ